MSRENDQKDQARGINSILNDKAAAYVSLVMEASGWYELKQDDLY